MKRHNVISRSSVLVVLLPAIVGCNATGSSVPRSSLSSKSVVTSTQSSTADQEAPPADLAPEAPNLADTETDRYLVKPIMDSFVRKGYTMESALGRGFNSEEGFDQFDCYSGTKQVEKVDNKIRYRLELKHTDASVTLRVSATVIKERQTLINAKLRSSARNAASKICGDSYVSALELGGRLQFEANYRNESPKDRIPPNLPAVLEVGNSKADVAYFESVLKAVDKAVSSRYDRTGYGVSVNDPRSGSSMMSELGATMTMDSLVNYAEGLAKAGDDELVLNLQQYLYTSPAL